MRFAIYTLGCKVNHYDSQRIREGLLAAGHTEQSFTEPGADRYIINTCTVTHRADAEGRRLVRRALRLGGRVVVTGCLVTVYPESIRAISPDVEVVRPDHLTEVLGVELPRFISGFGSQSRAYIMVQQGCDRYCTYCIVPLARGGPVSRPWQDVVTEARILHGKGFREVVLTGINIGLYEGGFSRLVQKVLSHTDMRRIRISSIEPWTVEDGLIDLVANEPRICRHLHLPLQHGSDGVLRAMGRPYSAGHVRSLMRRIREVSPGTAVGADVIVGFPGEDDQAFAESHAIIEDLGFTYLHVFPFSTRPGTAAANLPGRPDDEVISRRAAALRALSRKSREAFAASRIGAEEEVLITQSCDGRVRGLSSSYIVVDAPGRAVQGDIVRVRMIDLEGQTLQGEFSG
ncbi:MAG: MiaB/RimO family radical SAM methylthiotransferase [Deltaproteobacteria bacterium]|nr:MiaB/RimO family radical SAM methylthiotransferase [Deltaproteobacteria bacterium]